MSYITGYASNSYELLNKIDEILTKVGWETLDKRTSVFNGSTVNSYFVWKGKGDGNDNIYLQARIYDDIPTKIAFDSMAGYDEALYRFEQPGSLNQQLQCDADNTKKSIPALSVLKNELFYFWLFADSYRLIGITRMSIEYESFYLGFLNPIASERQYPYPMYIAGNTSLTGADWNKNTSGSFIFPCDDSGWLRLVDGVWRSFNAKPTEPTPNTSGTVFPYTAHNKQLIPNYKGKTDSSIVQDNFLLLPVILRTTNPTNMVGILRDVYWVSGTRDLSAEQTFNCNGDTYICFDVKQFRNSNSYFAVKMG